MNRLSDHSAKKASCILNYSVHEYDVTLRLTHLDQVSGRYSPGHDLAVTGYGADHVV